MSSMLAPKPMKSLAVAACVLVAISGPAGAARSPTASKSAQAKANASPSPRRVATASVDKLFAAWNKPTSPGCSLGISQDGRVMYERGYGMANVELDVAITPEPDIVIQVPGRAAITLRPISPDTFMGAVVGLIEFSRDTRGEISGFSVSTAGVRELRFTRVWAPD